MFCCTALCNGVRRGHISGIDEASRRSSTKAISKNQAFYVGEEAAQLLDAGMRLAGAEQSPLTLDLTRE